MSLLTHISFLGSVGFGPRAKEGMLERCFSVMVSTRGQWQVQACKKLLGPDPLRSQIPGTKLNVQTKKLLLLPLVDMYQDYNVLIALH